MTRSITFLAVVASLASTAVTHSFIDFVNIDGDHYYGYDPRPGGTDPPLTANRVVWAHNAPDQGWVNGSHYNTLHIACHRDATSVPAHAPVRAGQTVGVHWHGWPRIHTGPVLSYLAPCEGTSDGCASVDKTKLQWTMVDDGAPGLLSTEPSATNGTWATDFLIGNSPNPNFPNTNANNTWQVRVPAGLKPGPYVLRHEIIALHYGTYLEEGGAQHYPFCINLFVYPPAGTPPAPFQLTRVTSKDLYRVGHPGLYYDQSKRPMDPYVLPGPGLARGAQPVKPQEQFPPHYVKDGVPVRVRGTTPVPFVAKRAVETFAA